MRACVSEEFWRMHCDGSLVGFENGVAPSSRSTAIPLIGTVFRLNDLIGGLVLSRKMSVRDSWSRSRLLSHQRGAFLAMLRYARAASPFYRELYRGIHLTDG